ncbi:MAG: ferritin-like domain-containing protein [Caulobacteraceae bacterium]|nr:ferritin-like domain-containing protein [Caulobacter sp.]
MNDKLVLEALERRVERRNDRREFFKNAGVFAAGAAGMAALSACGGGSSGSTTPAVGQTSTISDADVLNFALNLEYLEANFYSVAFTGQPISASLQSGTGTQGAVNTAGTQMVPFSDPVVKAYAQEITKDEVNHVTFLRGALGNAAVAQPAIDISVSGTSAFTMAAQAAGLISSGQTFSPYLSDNHFLLGAFIFEDVGVTAYKGASPLIANKTYLEAAAGILAVEAYHAGLVRAAIFARGIDMPTAAPTPAGTLPNSMIIGAANAISDARDSLDGSSDDDQGVGSLASPTLVPTDGNSIAFSRTTTQVLDIVYLTKAAATKGGFFPNGVNGTINASAVQS